MLTAVTDSPLPAEKAPRFRPTDGERKKIIEGKPKIIEGGVRSMPALQVNRDRNGSI